MLLFLFVLLSAVFLSLQDVPKKVFLVNRNGEQGSYGPRSDGTEFAK